MVPWRGGFPPAPPSELSELSEASDMPSKILPMFSPAFLKLLRLGLWSDIPCGPEVIFPAPLSHSEWKAIADEARRQAVAGIVYAGIERLPDTILPPPSGLVRWVAAAGAIETQNLRISGAITSLARIFSEAGLNPVLLKGHSVARHYARPELRQSGDIDIYFPTTGEFGRASDIVASLGHRPERHSDGSMVYDFRGIVVEHHPELLDIHASGHRREAKRIIADEGFVPSPDFPGMLEPSPVLEYLLVSTHIMKHSFGVGVGLRQICDYARLRADLANTADKAEIVGLTASLGLSRWRAVLDDFVEVFLDPVQEPGVSTTKLPPVISPLCRSFARIVFGGGNFGVHDPLRSRLVSPVAIRAYAALSFLRRARFSLRISPSEALAQAGRLAVRR